jgi:hypothetical protein
MGLDLLENIRSNRTRQRRKQPYRRDVFNTVSFIVKEYGLGENFLKRLNKAESYLSQKTMKLSEVKTKKLFEPPPFSLVSQEDYRLAVTIVGKLDNPYLPFAHSPEEILLSAPLYKANPSLRSEDLLRCDFETLLLCQRAKEELADLEKRLGSINGTVGQGKEMEEYRGERSQVSFLQERIKQLQAFIAKVENTESQPE